MIFGASKCFRPASFCAQITRIPLSLSCANCSSLGPRHRPTYTLIPAARYFAAFAGLWSHTASGKKFGSARTPIFSGSAVVPREECLAASKRQTDRHRRVRLLSNERAMRSLNETTDFEEKKTKAKKGAASGSLFIH